MRNYPNIAQSFGIGGMLILSFTVFYPVYFILRKLIGSDASMFITYLLAVGVTFWVVSFIKRKKTGSISFNRSVKNKSIIPFVIIGSAFLYCGIVSPLSGLIPMPESAKEALIKTGAQIGFFAFFQTVFVAPIFEELIFRGIILEGLLTKHSPTKSIIISSLIFGIAHLGPAEIVFGLIMGCFSGWVYYKTRSVAYSIVIHAIANLTSILMRHFLISESMRDNILLGIYGGITNLIIVVACSVLIVLICIYFLKREFKKDDQLTVENRVDCSAANY